MHVGRDERLPIALYAENAPAIVSPAYMTFEVINTQELLPEYLMMIFQPAAEFDRFTWFVRPRGRPRPGSRGRRC